MTAKKNMLSGKPIQYPSLTPGLYTYHTSAESENQFRLHLRVEPDGEGILVVNAATVLHLNRSATEFAYYLIQGKDNVQIVDEMSKRYEASREVLMRDVQLFIDQILYLSRQNDLSPTATIGFEPHTFNKNLSAPLRLDCCLTHRVFSTKDDAELAAGELSTDDWKAILTKLHKAGIPHVVFFGGEPTLREDLTELLAYTEELGLVSGLVSSDPSLKNSAVLLPLIEAGLDHLTFSLDPSQAEVLEGLSNILDQDLFTCLRLPVRDENVDLALLRELRQLGANAFNLLAGGADSYFRVNQLRHLADAENIPFVDDMPLTCDPQAADSPATIWDPEIQPVQQLLIQPDGSLAESADNPDTYGNLVREDWTNIWNKVLHQDEV